jgi:hypothetical protein
VADAVALLEPAPLQPRRRSRWRPLLPGVAVAVLLGVTVLAYVRFLGIGFVATDSLPLIEASRLASLADAVDLFRKPLMAGTRFAEGEIVWRPFVSVMFGIDYLVWGLNAVGYHITNLALHLLSVLMMWRLLTLLGLRWWSCLIGAAVFALHPLAVVSVPVIARRDSIAPVTAFTVGWVLLLVAERASGGRRVLALAGSVVMAGIALLSKESAFVAVGLLPVLIAARAYADGADGRTATARCKLAAPYLAVAAVVFIVRFGVLGGLGGNVEDPEQKFIWDRYTQVLGAYTRDLTWSFSGLASSNREVWPVLAGVLLLGLGIASRYLPRRQGALALLGLSWLLGYALFAMLFRIATIGWLAYFALVGVAIVWAAGLEGAVDRVREGPGLGRPRWRWITSVGLLLTLGGLGLSWLATSALVRGYDQWQFAGDISRRYVDGLYQCAAASPAVGHVRLDGMPSILDDGQADTNQLGVTLFEDYTIHSALHLLFPQRDLTLTVWSRETLRDVHQDISLACASDPTRVYLVATY